jgi:protein-tyrosine phosphatase
VEFAFKTGFHLSPNSQQPMDAQNSRILFLCTGNYYRSRFAEHFFNHHAAHYQLPWRAFSRGLAIELVGEDAGPISPSTVLALNAREIALEETRFPIALTERDLKSAHHIVALKQAEHHPLLARKFPSWVERVEYWHVHDIDLASPTQAIPQIEEAVLGLISRFSGQRI